MDEENCVQCDQPISLAREMETRLQAFGNQVVSTARCAGCSRVLGWRSKAATFGLSTHNTLWYGSGGR